MLGLEFRVRIRVRVRVRILLVCYSSPNFSGEYAK